MIIPHEALDPATLRSLVEDFVTRDGASTMAGHQDLPLESLVDTVLRQLKSGRVVVVYEEAGESCSIVPRDGLRKESA